jgi:hypothetical protein
LNVSGLPSPRCRRFCSAKRPNFDADESKAKGQH